MLLDPKDKATQVRPPPRMPCLRDALAEFFTVAKAQSLHVRIPTLHEQEFRDTQKYPVQAPLIFKKSTQMIHNWSAAPVPHPNELGSSPLLLSSVPMIEYHVLLIWQLRRHQCHAPDRVLGMANMKSLFQC